MKPNEIGIDTRQVSYEIKSKMHELSGKFMALNKDMWNNNRKAHRLCSSYFKKFKDQISDITRYYVMQDPEVRPFRAMDFCKQMITFHDAVLENLKNSAEDFSDYIERVEKIKEETQALMVLISIDDHEKSFWA